MALLLGGKTFLPNEMKGINVRYYKDGNMDNLLKRELVFVASVGTPNLLASILKS
jgi:hypothetical protein